MRYFDLQLNILIDSSYPSGKLLYDAIYRIKLLGHNFLSFYSGVKSCGTISELGNFLIFDDS